MSQAPAETRCDNTSVGVLITDGEDRWLMFERATPPVGVAPAAGHVDGHGSPERAAAVEVSEELGLTIGQLTYVDGGWRGNRCRRVAGPQGPGHLWTVYLARADGTPTPSAREVRRPHWFSRPELQRLASRTHAYARGHLTAAEFAAEPGVEPVWMRFLRDAGLVVLDESALAAVEELAAAG
jgi:8-oxo-dGTP pyrophosphatase MutT (NUDIX family)